MSGGALMASASIPTFAGLKFTAIDTCVFTLTIGSYVSTSILQYVEYSTNEGKTWTKTNNVDSTSVTITTPSIPAGGTVCWRGVGLQYTSSATLNSTRGSRFTSTGRFYASGNIMSLLSINFDDALTVRMCAFFGLFYNNSGIVSCPELPATKLANYCYCYMFYGCTSLTTVPDLPATTLTTSCYAHMFQGCRNLNYIKAMFTTTPSDSYTQSWVSGVASSGTFVKNSSATWDVTGDSGIPSGWTVQNA